MNSHETVEIIGAKLGLSRGQRPQSVEREA
jgi:hypothetical protein